MITSTTITTRVLKPIINNNPELLKNQSNINYSEYSKFPKKEIKQEIKQEKKEEIKQEKKEEKNI